MKCDNNDISVTKRVCAITMVRNDKFFLEKWVSYYRQELGEENLYVFFDGKDQVVPEFCQGINAIICNRVKGKVVKADKGRINYLSDKARELFEKYDIVIGADVDEFLVVDPLVGLSLKEYINQTKYKNSISGLGIDVGQHLDKEEKLVSDKTILSQRSYGYLSSRYTKANILLRPLMWGSGFHRVKGKSYNIDPNLYLFHFGSVDMAMLQDRIQCSDRLANGWSRHLRKRAKTIFIITKAKVYKWHKVISIVRFIQKFLHPIYARNKPCMPIKVVVEIPDRFKQII